MDLGEVVERLGGVCTSRKLRSIAWWRSIAAALESGQLVRVGRGTYSLPGTDRDQLVATRFRATDRRVETALSEVLHGIHTWTRSATA